MVGLLQVLWVSPRAQASPVVGALGFVSNLLLGWGCRLLPEAVPFLFPCVRWNDKDRQTQADMHRHHRQSQTWAGSRRHLPKPDLSSSP